MRANAWARHNNKEAMMPSDLIYKHPHIVASAECDRFGRMRLGALVNQLIQAAGASADALGFGYRDLLRQRRFWVLSRLSLELAEPLTWMTSMEVETWPRDVERRLYLRDFFITSKARRIGRASSAWLALDQEKRKPVRLEGSENEVFTRLREHMAIATGPQRLHDCRRPGDAAISTRRNYYFDLDINGHVTTTRYLDWLLDTFALDYHGQHFPSRLHINFVREVLPGQTLDIYRTALQSDVYAMVGVDQSSASLAYLAELGFSPARPDYS
jgi:medium-chain acyl-[acyl-carrier-protein] hydrolase